MPLEIRELHIKATVADDDQGSGGSQSSPQSGEFTLDDIITACVDRVLQILHDKEER